MTTPKDQHADDKALEWVKAQPHETYDGLKSQFVSLKSLVNSMGQQITYWSRKSYETGEKHLKELQASLESERAMNAQLTEELSALSSQQCQPSNTPPLDALERAKNDLKGLDGCDEYNRSGYLEDFYHEHLDTIRALIDAAISQKPVDAWIKTTDRLPEKPGKKSYEYVDCLIYHKGEIKQRPWNCEHLCWDDEHYDDHYCDPTEPTHWMPLPPAPQHPDKER